MNTGSLKIALGFTAICAIWGSTWLVIKLSLDSMPPVFSGGMRFLAATFFFLLIMRLNHVKLQYDSTAIKLYVFMGIFSFVLPFGLVYWAEQFIATGLTSVLFTTYPFLVILFSRLALPGERVGIFKILGTITGFIGIFFIFADDMSMDFDRDIWGMLAILLSSALQAGTTVIIKKHGKPLNPLSMNLVPVAIAAVVMIPFGLLFEDTSQLNFDLNALFSVSYLGLVGTVATFSTYYWLLKRMDMVILSLNAFISPIIAIFLGWFILSENFTGNDITGSILVLSGLLLANTRGLKNYFNRKNALV